MFPFSRKARWETGRHDGLSYPTIYEREGICIDYQTGFQYGREQSDSTERCRRIKSGEPAPYDIYTLL